MQQRRDNEQLGDDIFIETQRDTIVVRWQITLHSDNMLDKQFKLMREADQ